MNVLFNSDGVLRRTSPPHPADPPRFRLPVGCSDFILFSGAGYLVVGLAVFAVWLGTGNDRWVVDFFRYPAALVSIAFASIQLWFSQTAARKFSPEQPMATAWKLISFSAACDVVSAVSIQVLADNSAWNPLARTSWWTAGGGSVIRDFGSIVGGPARYSLLAAGLGYALRAYKRAGLQPKWKHADRIVLAIMGFYLLVEVGQVTSALSIGSIPSPSTVLGWPTDPLLWLLLGQALLLYRSAQLMGGGWIGRCWKAFSIGVFLVAASDIAAWASTAGFLHWPWSALQWYLWLPAAGVFALAPAYQLEAIAYAGMAGNLRAQPGQLRNIPG